MITGKKITDSVVNCKIIKAITVPQTQQRNVSQYFVNKNVKIQPQNPSKTSQNESQTKRQQAQKDGYKQNEDLNQIQSSKTLNTQKSTKTKSQKNIAQKITNTTVDKKNISQKNKPIAIKQVKKNTLQMTKSQKMLPKPQKVVTNQTKINKIEQKTSIIEAKKINQLKQCIPKDKKQIKNQVSNKEQTKNKPFQPIKTQKQLKQHILNKQKVNEVQVKTLQKPLNIIYNQETQINVSNNDSDLQEEQKIIPSPIQIYSMKINQKKQQQKDDNHEKPEVNQKLDNSLNQFLKSDLIYSKINLREGDQNSFIGQDDSICILNTIQKGNIQNPKQLIQIQLGELTLQKREIQSQNSYRQDQNQNQYPAQIDQNYLNFQLSFQETILINNCIEDSKYNSKKDLCGNMQDQQELQIMYQRQQSMLLQQNLRSNSNIYRNDNFIPSQNEEVNKITSSMNFSQTLAIKYANYRYFQSSDQEDYEQMQKAPLEFFQTYKDTLKIQNKENQKHSMHSILQNQQSKQNLNQNSSQQQSQEQNQAIQAYLRARNMVTKIPKGQQEDNQQIRRQYAKNVVKFDNTIIQQSFQQDSIMILKNSKKSVNESQHSQDLSNLQLFSLDMEELIKKDFIMI